MLSNKDESYDSLLVITRKGKIAVVFCPFRAICLTAVDTIRENTLVYIDAVIQHPEYKLAYIISGKCYPYYCFQLTIKY